MSRASASGPSGSVKTLLKLAEANDLEKLRASFSFEEIREARDAEGCACAQRAARADAVDVLRFALDEVGCVVDAPSRVGKTALYEACNAGHVRSAEILLERGATLDEAKTNQWRPLHAACAKGHDAVVRLLLERVARRGGRDAVLTLTSSQTTKEGSTPMHLAIRERHARVVETLLAFGADPNALSSNKRPPVFAAIHAGDAALFRLLHVAHHARLVQADGKSPIVDASGATAWHELASTTSEDEAVISEMAGFLQGLDCDTLDVAGRRPVHAAAQDGNPFALKAILARIEDVDVPEASGSGSTALMIAAVKGYESCVELLLSAGASASKRDAAGRTAASLAEDWRQTRVSALFARNGA